MTKVYIPTHKYGHTIIIEKDTRTGTEIRHVFKGEATPQEISALISNRFKGQLSKKDLMDFFLMMKEEDDKKSGKKEEKE